MGGSGKGGGMDLTEKVYAAHCRPIRSCFLQPGSLTGACAVCVMFTLYTASGAQYVEGGGGGMGGQRYGLG